MTLSRSTPMRRKRMRQGPSDKQAAKRDKRATWAVAVKARDPVCMNRGPLRLGCGAKTADAHHVLARSQGGGDDLSNGLGLCHSCHMWAHDHRIEAQALGLLAHVGDCSDIPGARRMHLEDTRG